METATTEIYTLSLHDALPISEIPATAGRRMSKRTANHHPLREGRAPTRRDTETANRAGRSHAPSRTGHPRRDPRSEEHTSELQSRLHLVCRLLLEKKKKQNQK